MPEPDSEGKRALAVAALATVETGLFWFLFSGRLPPGFGAPAYLGVWLFAYILTWVTLRMEAKQRAADTTAPEQAVEPGAPPPPSLPPRPDPSDGGSAP